MNRSLVLIRLLRATAGRALLGLYRTRLRGQEAFPEGPAIIASNHVSYLDPVLLWCGAPRPVHFMAKAELWENAILGWAIGKLLAFPVKRGAPDRTAIATASSLLATGELVGIFPEGTRTRDPQGDELGQAYEGVAFLALRTGAPVVPVGISGTERVMPPGAKLPRFPSITVRYDVVVRPEDFAQGTRKQRVEEMTAEIMGRIADARESARGV